MANVKLGLLVSEIAGTVNGATFRRSASGLVLQKWNSGASKSKLAINKKLASQSTFVKNWSFLSSSRQAEWDAAALLFQFPDKFGDLRYLSGRQLYLKLAGNMQIVGSPIIDLTTIDSVQPTYSSITVVFKTDEVMTVSFVGSDSFGYYLLQIEPIYDGQSYINWGRSKIIGIADNSVSSVINFTSEFFERFPYVDTNKNFRFFITSMNDYGFRSQSEVATEQLTAEETRPFVNLYSSPSGWIALTSYSYAADFDIETNVLFKSVPSGAFLLFGSNNHLAIFPSGTSRLTIAGTQITFTFPLPFYLDYYYNVRVLRVSGTVYIMVDGNIVKTEVNTDTFAINRIGHIFTSSENFSQGSFRFGTDLYLVDEMTGATLASSGVNTGTITTVDDPNDFWQEITYKLKP